VPGIHVLLFLDEAKDVDGRDKPGHDDVDGAPSIAIGVRPLRERAGDDLSPLNRRRRAAG
jgi:hypothetical protein